MNIIDISKQRFGHLVVIELAQNKRKGAWWKCKCDCGNEKIISGSSLRSGQSNSCGCKNPQNKSLIGRRQDKLLIVEKVGRSNYGTSLWRCLCDCGNEIVRCSSGVRKLKDCGCSRQKPIGHRITTSSGYTIIKVANKFRAGNKNYKYEHQHVMEQYLGRLLKPHERIHHINGRRNDNEINNLELWTRDHPDGQRVDDMLTWAKKILKEYGYKIKCPHEDQVSHK